VLENLQMAEMENVTPPGVSFSAPIESRTCDSFGVDADFG